ncbi:MAG: dihydrofolate reductase [Candidatus Magasanikbacteria bacterium]
MSLSLIAAIASNNCIGKNNSLPWHMPEDLKHFKELTTGSVVLMGRNTWESLPEKFRPLPDRKNIVITRNTEYQIPDGVFLYHSIDDALKAHEGEDIFVIGGAMMYKQTIDLADRLYITHVEQDVDGDAFFPEIDPTVWKEVGRDNREEFSFVEYRKI